LKAHHRPGSAGVDHGVLRASSTGHPDRLALEVDVLEASARGREHDIPSLRGVDGRLDREMIGRDVQRGGASGGREEE